ncbi:dodecenoyl-CoA isomerase [Lithohypha guttulata]|nr:dodecenoyl-CoA isomerase [Lithohypha guttulata]
MSGPSDKELQNEVTLTYKGRVAIITFNRTKKLNAMTQQHYYRISCLLREVALRDEVVITVLTGTGRFFSAGADVGSARPPVDPNTQNSTDADKTRRDIMSGFVANNLDLTRSVYMHPKILVAALNGPAVGISAALLGFCDFIYAAPHTYFLTPFSSLGLVAEGGASYGLVQRMGISTANEALMMSRKISCEKLVHCGFVNKVFQGKDQNDSEGFLKQVLDELDDKLGSHLNSESLLGIKKLVRAPYEEALEAQGVREVMAGMSVFLKGAPQEEFRKLASGEKRHKFQFPAAHVIRKDAKWAGSPMNKLDILEVSLICLRTSHSAVLSLKQNLSAHPQSDNAWTQCSSCGCINSYILAIDHFASCRPSKLSTVMKN